MHKKTLPNLIIAGGNRCGSTSLYKYLSMHEKICGSSIKETNYFVPLLYNSKLPRITKYYKYFVHCDNYYRFVLEASPRYMFGGHTIANAINKLLGNIIIIFILRNPVDRLFSYYKQSKGSRLLSDSETFNEFANTALRETEKLLNIDSLREVNVYSTSIYVRALLQGLYSEYLEGWYAVFHDNIKVVFFDDLKKDPMNLMRNLCEQLKISSRHYTNDMFTIENKSVNYRSRLFHYYSKKINENLEVLLRKHYRIKNKLRNIYLMLNEKHTKQNEIVKGDIIEIQKFYSKYNKKLFRLLNKRGYIKLPKWITSGNT
jgi:hypothetical protein